MQMSRPSAVHRSAATRFPSGEILGRPQPPAGAARSSSWPLRSTHPGHGPLRGSRADRPACRCRRAGSWTPRSPCPGGSAAPRVSAACRCRRRPLAVDRGQRRAMSRRSVAGTVPFAQTAIGSSESRSSAATRGAALGSRGRTVNRRPGRREGSVDERDGAFSAPDGRDQEPGSPPCRHSVEAECGGEDDAIVGPRARFQRSPISPKPAMTVGASPRTETRASSPSPWKNLIDSPSGEKRDHYRTLPPHLDLMVDKKRQAFLRELGTRSAPRRERWRCSAWLSEQERHRTHRRSRSFSPVATLSSPARPARLRAPRWRRLSRDRGERSTLRRRGLPLDKFHADAAPVVRPEAESRSRSASRRSARGRRCGADAPADFSTQRRTTRRTKGGVTADSAE